ncbi:MAG: archaetidylserine decarboxylase [Gammaproteobacteria bacterium]
MRATLFVLLQYLLPQHGLSRLTGALAACRIGFVKVWLIRRFIAAFGVDMREAAEPDPSGYPHFNAFFTRALRPGARPVDMSPEALVSPADGAVSQAGRIEAGRIVQAKGRWFSAAELLADAADASRFDGGHFATIYLSPKDYHRVHMPCDARLVGLRYIPGQLFSVNGVTADSVPGLFARNERLVCQFETACGPMAMVLVGAMIVAGIETVWTGAIAPAGRAVLSIALESDTSARSIDRGAEMGRFQLGSTVILLFPRGAIDWDPLLQPGAPLRMGQRIGRRNPAA